MPIVRIRLVSSLFLWTLVTFLACAHAQRNYLGFDRNGYPGNESLNGLRSQFRYVGYWLNVPPGAQTNTWAGKRDLLKQRGFGFLVLFNGRPDAQLIGNAAAALGAADGMAAVAAASKEGFPHHVLIFLDQEEGGRLLTEQSAYIWAWVDAVVAAGARAGVYCSGIDVPEGAGTISTARDLAAQQKAHGTPLALWVANDRCPPSPGCARTDRHPGDGGLTEAMVWQYAQSPRRAQFSAGCPKNDDADGNCYTAGLPHSADTFVDLNVASSPDPSGGRE